MKKQYIKVHNIVIPSWASKDKMLGGNQIINYDKYIIIGIVIYIFFFIVNGDTTFIIMNYNGRYIFIRTGCVAKT